MIRPGHGVIEVEDEGEQGFGFGFSVENTGGPS